MKNITNIYDIDGELIREAGDNNKMTLEEAQQRSRDYQDKLKQLLEDDPNSYKTAVYRTYIDNLNRYIFSIYQGMTPEELKEIFKPIMPEKTDESEVQKAIEQLKKELENDGETGEDTKNEVSGQPSERGEGDDNEESGNVSTIKRPESSVQEERAVSQSDLLVERDNITPTVMDEYVEFTEE